MIKKYKFLFLLFGLFIFFPEDTLAATYQQISLNSVSSMETTGSLTPQSIQSFSHYGRTFLGYSRSGVVGRSRFLINANNTGLKLNQQYDIDFLIYYTNVRGQEGAVPMVYFQNKMCSVVSAGYYKSLNDSYILSGSSFGNPFFSCGNGSSFDCINTDYNISITENSDYDINYLFGVSCDNVSINNLSEIPIDVYTGTSDSIRATPEYSILNSLAYELNGTSVIKDSIDSNTDAQKETTDATKEQTDFLKDSDTSDAESSASNFFGDLDSNNHGLSGLITQPLNFLRSLTGTTCEPLQFELPFVHDVVYLPCMKSIYQQHFGVFFTLYQMLTTGIIAYSVGIRLLGRIKGLQDPQNDRIEVFNL